MKTAILIMLVFLSTISANTLVAQNTYEVNSLGDGTDTNPGDGICFTGIISGNIPFKLHCSLRAAIEEANAHPNGASPDRIFFTNLPIVGKKATISLSGDALPAITDAVIMDGTTASGPVLLSRTSTQFFNGLELEAGSQGSTIRDMAFGNFWHGIIVLSDDNSILHNHVGTDFSGTDLGNNYGIQVQGNDNVIKDNTLAFSDAADIWATGNGHLIQGNFIGTNATGSDLAHPLQVRGIIAHEGTGFTIGGPTPIEQNVINAAQIGIDIRRGEEHIVQGNFIGTNASGVDFGTLEWGILISGAMNVTIGGTTPGTGNTIGHCEIGIYVSTGEGHDLLGNYIGTNEQEEDLGCTVSGISLEDTHNILVGALSANGGNTVAFNEKGIIAVATTESKIRGNHIFANAELGIDLDDDGATLNDAGDSDTGANQLQNYPDVVDVDYNNNRELAIFEYAVSSDSLIVPYPLTIDFYIADDPASGQGKTYIGTDLYNTQDETVVFGVDTTGLAINENDVFVATATDLNGNTSEFSPVTQALGLLSIAPGLGPVAEDELAILDRDTMDRAPVVGTYPNPFNPQTTVTIGLPASSHIRISVHDMLGRQVALLYDGNLSAGISHTFIFDGADLASGAYLLRVLGDGFVETRRITLLK